MIYVIIRSSYNKKTMHCTRKDITPIKRNDIPLGMYFENMWNSWFVSCV